MLTKDLARPGKFPVYKISETRMVGDRKEVRVFYVVEAPDGTSTTRGSREEAIAIAKWAEENYEPPNKHKKSMKMN